MTYISPLLQNKLGITAQPQQNNNNNQSPVTNILDSQKRNFDMVYEELRSRANEVKPNEAKAKLVMENPLQAVVSSIKDFKQDVSNLSSAVVNGKLSDFPLGRLNDLGLKFGSLLIAAFLAKGSKTKTEAIMKFVGGGAFIASMSLWPKLFINLPARLVHGFRIDEKYISAQGDKKDFFLDNQFLPWDCYPKDRLMQNAKRSGIDPEDPNSEEKIQRKMQKTALQNRTLWMATAGFATPVMTSLICSSVEPHIQNAVIQHDVKNAIKTMSSPENLAKYLDAAKPDVQNREAIDTLFKEYSAKSLDDNFFTKLAEYLNLGIKTATTDDVKAINGSFSKDLIPTLQQLAKEQPVLTDDSSLKGLADKLSQITVTAKNSGGLDSMMSLVADATPVVNTLSQDEISSIMTQVKALEEPTLENITAILKQNGISAENQIKDLTSTLKFNNTTLFGSIKDYNENVLSVIRGRLKSYNKLVNQIVGSRAESAYTKIANDSIKALFKQLNLSNEELKTLSTGASELFDPSSAAFQFDKAREVLINAFNKFAQQNKDLESEEYAKKLQEFIGKEYKFDLGSTVTKLADKDVIAKVTDVQSGSQQALYSRLTDAIFGSKDKTSSLFDRISQFIKSESINLDAMQNKAILCANLERRIIDGSLRDSLKDLMETSNTSFDDFVRIARKMIYDNSVSLDACKGEIQLSPDTYSKLKEILYNPEAFNKEMGVKVVDVLKNFRGSNDSSLKDLLVKLKNLGTTSKDYSRASSFFQMAKNTATQITNTGSWKKHCWGFGIALAAVTLLVQPLFGKIDKEFPNNADKKIGGAN